MTIHRRLVDEHGLEARVASLRRWVRANLPETARRGQVTVLGPGAVPGEQAQIDYGWLVGPHVRRGRRSLRATGWRS